MRVCTAGNSSVGLIDQSNNVTIVQLIAGTLVQLPRGESVQPMHSRGLKAEFFGLSDLSVHRCPAAL